MTDPMASEPAEPTTRPQDDVIERAARAIANVDGVDRWSTAGESTRDDIRGEARALADLGLLADPAQTTELERLRRRATAFEKQWMETQDELDDRQKFVHDVAAERDEARAQRNEAMETAGQLRDEVREHQVAAANLYSRVFVALGLSITAPWAGLADAAGRVRAERDALSLLLRGMARRAHTLRLSMNIQYREVCDAKDVIDEVIAERDQAVGAVVHAVRLLREAGVNRGNGLPARVSALISERDALEEILSKERRRVDAALALIDAATSTGPYFLSPDETRAVRAALVGDQPGDLPSEPRSDLERAPDAPTELGAGVALRDVEEADDAAGDRP